MSTARSRDVHKKHGQVVDSWPADDGPGSEGLEYKHGGSSEAFWIAARHVCDPTLVTDT